MRENRAHARHQAHAPAPRALSVALGSLLLATVPWHAALADGGNGGCSSSTTPNTCTPAAGGTPGAPNGAPGLPNAGGVGGTGGGGGSVTSTTGTGGAGGSGGNGAANGGGGGNGAAGQAGSGVAGAGGGAGGAGGNGGTNAGGTLQNGAGGGGGGGGGDGVIIATDATSAGVVTGGAGGNAGGGGGNGSAQTGGGGSGGGGGEGGSGVLVTGNATGTNSGQIMGGKGGNGGGGGSPRGTGDGATLVAGAGGAGGAGGNGVIANAGGTLINTDTGSIVGGNGANGGGAGSATSTGPASEVPIGGRGGDAGIGGSGVFVTGGSMVTNSGLIQGGNGGNGENGGFGSGAGAVVSGGGGLGGSGGLGAWIVGNGTITNAQGARIIGGNGGTGGGGSTLNQSGTGDISGGLGADGGSGGAGVLLTGGGSVDNAGAIAGGNGNRSGGGSNATGGGAAGGAGSGGDGVSLDGGGTVTNRATGTISGGHGGDNSVGGGGGGGTGGNGIALQGGGSVQNAGTSLGGDGGAGANANVTNGEGGDGSAGGAGVFISGTGTVENVAGATITGGNGGTGGGGNGSGLGGTGGAGGDGVLVTNGGTLDNAGSIVGGNGNRGGGGGGASGSGGLGVSGSNMTVINSGSIQGGLAGNNGARNDAILFTGGTSTLELRAGSTIAGIVDATQGANTLALGGGTDSSFDASLIGPAAQYRGFSAYLKTGSSTWALTGTTTAVTPWTIDEGVLNVTDNASLGDSAGTLTFHGGTLQLGASLAMDRPVALAAAGGTIDTQAYTGSIATPITGPGGLVKTGTGTLLLTGTNGYTGGTTISAGTLQLGDGGTSGSLIGDVANAGTLVFDRSDTSTYAGVVSGPGQVVQQGTGTTIFTGAHTYTGGTTISAGTLQLGDGGTSGSLTGDVANSGTLRFNRSDDATFAGNVSGAGRVSQDGTGTTILTGTHTYTGGTTIAAGTLQLGDGGTTGSLLGDVLNNGTLTFNRSDVSTFPGTISGAGVVRQAGTGTTVLTGDSQYTGGTHIDAGTLQLGNGGTTGSLIGDVANGGTLSFNHSNALTFAGVISDGDTGTPGNVTQDGTGTTLLTAVNTYSGNTAVNHGTLAIGDAASTSATLAGGGETTVANGATLGGYGSVAGNVTNHGTVAVADATPGLAGQGSGSFIIGGTLTNAGVANVGGAGVGNRLVVTRYVGQAGTLRLNAELNGDGSPSDRLVINGGAASGTTSILVTNVGGLGARTPGNGIQVVETQAGGTTAAGSFALGNRVEAGPYQYTLFRGARDGSADDAWYLRTENTNPPITTPQVVPPSLPPPEVPAVVPDYRPEVSLYTTLPSMALNYGRALTGTLHERVGEEATSPSSVWLRVLGQDGEWNAKRGGVYRDGPSFDDNMVAVQGGTDLWRGDHDDRSHDVAGIMGAAGHGHGSVDNFDGTTAGRDRLDAYTLGAYWTHFTPSRAYIDGVVQGTWYHTRATSPYHNDIKSNGFGWTASIEGGNPVALAQDWAIEPQAQAIYQHLSLDKAQDAAARIRFADAASLVSRLGARVTHGWASSDTSQAPTTGWLLANAWHESRGNAKTAFSSAEGDVPFHSDLGGTWWELGLGITATVGPRGSLYATVSYERAFGNGIESLNGTVGYRYNW